MRTTRFYCPDLVADQQFLDLPDDVHRHAVQVLRLKKGDVVRIFDGKGLEVEACFIDIQKRKSQVEILSKRPSINESPLETLLLQAISRGERMDYAIQKAVELGVTKIIPVMTEHCNVQLAGERADKKMQHWQGIVVSACEQSGRNVLPQLEQVMDIEQALSHVQSRTKIILDPEAENSFTELEKTESVALLIGPEGGFSERDLSQAKAAGFIGVKFGPRILRTETASTAALAVLQTLWGDLK